MAEILKRWQDACIHAIEVLPPQKPISQDAINLIHHFATEYKKTKLAFESQDVKVG